MEALAILFVVGVFYFVNTKDKPPKKKKPGEELAAGLEAFIGQYIDKKPGKKEKEPDPLPWGIIWTSIFIGLALIYAL